MSWGGSTAAVTPAPGGGPLPSAGPAWLSWRPAALLWGCAPPCRPPGPALSCPGLSRGGSGLLLRPLLGNRSTSTNQLGETRGLISALLSWGSFMLVPGGASPPPVFVFELPLVAAAAEAGGLSSLGVGYGRSGGAGGKCELTE